MGDISPLEMKKKRGLFFNGIFIFQSAKKNVFNIPLTSILGSLQVESKKQSRPRNTMSAFMPKLASAWEEEGVSAAVGHLWPVCLAHMKA